MQAYNANTENIVINMAEAGACALCTESSRLSPAYSLFVAGVRFMRSKAC
jgi:hypothetical protein